MSSLRAVVVTTLVVGVANNVVGGNDRVTEFGGSGELVEV